ncbi:MAG: hypothetical protein K0S34_2630 [Bacillales bacterium]|jgi:hypothetical protein|nr:hypothetical protein [Bacillales bacterium]
MERWVYANPIIIDYYIFPMLALLAINCLIENSITNNGARIIRNKGTMIEGL